MVRVPSVSETGSMLNGSERPSPLVQLMARLPVTGTLSCMASVGVKRRITDAESPCSSDAISRGVAIDIHEGISTVILPVAPRPVLVMVKG